MPTATANRTKKPHRLMAVPPLPPPSVADLARLRAIAALKTAPKPDADSPEIDESGRFVEVPHPFVPLEIAPQILAWYSSHGGNTAINRALRAYIRAQATVKKRSGRQSVARAHRLPSRR